jgi:hypothetical protein
MHLFEIIYDLSHKDLHKIGSQMGSNPGGLYKIDDESYYVKFPSNPDIAKIEVLANKIYKLLDVYVPEVELIEKDNKIGLTSKIVDVLDDDVEDYMEKLSNHSDIKDNFVIDAWLANWDVGGFDFYSKNVLLDKNNRALRIDQGGSLTRRAQGGLKGSSFNDIVSEIESLRSSKATSMNRNLFNKINEKDIQTGLQKLKNLDITKLKKLINEYAPEDEKELIYKTLINRRNYLLSNLSS